MDSKCNCSAMRHPSLTKDRVWTIVSTGNHVEPSGIRISSVSTGPQPRSKGKACNTVSSPCVCRRLHPHSSVTIPAQGILSVCWRPTRLLNQEMSDLDVGNLERLGPLGECSESCPEVYQGLHGLEIRLLEQIESRRCQDEVAETAIHRLLQVQAKHVVEVRPVKVRVDAEHLAEDGLACLHEVLGESAPLAHPILTRLRRRSAKCCVVGV